MADVIVVGGGVAGMRAALAASQGGASVLLISRYNPTRSHSVTIQDGINAALGAADSPEQHAAETVKEGGYLADQALVLQVCKEAPSVLEELDKMGLPFNRDGGKFAQVQLAGSSTARTAFADDMTGHVLTHVLYEQSLKAAFQIMDEWAVIALAVDGSRCTGVAALEIPSGKVEVFPAKAVVLATGSPRRLYEPSTASLTDSGDGLALAYRAGATLIDMEMVQYHPYVVRDTHLALSEVLGIEPRYQVDGTVDLTNLPGIGTDRFYTTRNRLAALVGVDPRKAPVPVQPAMNRLLGGIAIDRDGATNVTGLYAAGACAGSTFHGAQGIAGNFLLESLALARRAGAAAAFAATAHAPAATFLPSVQAEVNGVMARPSSRNVAQIRKELAALMHEKAGQTRSAAGLQEAASQVKELSAQHQAAGLTTQQREYNHSLMYYLELGHLLDVAGAIVAAASARQESRGVHQRSDHPNKDEKEGTRHTAISFNGTEPAVDSRPVQIESWQPA